MNDYKIKEFKQPNTEEATKLILSEDMNSVVVENTEAYYSERYGWTLRRKNTATLFKIVIFSSLLLISNFSPDLKFS